MSESKRMGFWNEENHEIFLETSEYSIITLLKLIWRYGLGSIFGMVTTVSQALRRFLNIYEFLDNGEVFGNLDEFLQRIE